MSGFLAKYRDYSLISKIELEFFSKLSACSKQFKGAEVPGDMSHTVAAALDNAAHFINSRGNNALNVVVCFDVSDCQSRNRKYVNRMYLGTKLIPSNVPKERQATHFVALTNGDSCEVKIHFDLDFDVAADEHKPSPHIQIGGRALKTRKSKFAVRWNDDLDKPRWLSLPYCTPLLWHAAFLEFQECASVVPFVRQGWWKNLVRDAEKALWLPFFDDMKSILSNGCAIEAFYPPSK